MNTVNRRTIVSGIALTALNAASAFAADQPGHKDAAIDTSAAKAEIDSLIRGVFEAFARGNPAAIEAAETPDVTIWDLFTPQLIRGQEELRKFHAADKSQMQARGALSWSIRPDMVIDVWGDTAVARYYLDFSYAPPNPTEGHSRITDVLRRIEGRWRIVHHHEGMVPTGIPPISGKGPS